MNTTNTTNTKKYILIGLAILFVVAPIISVMADSELGDNFEIPGYFIGLINRSYVVGQQDIDDAQNVSIIGVQVNDTNQDAAIAGKEPTITGSTNNVFWNGLKQFVSLSSLNISDFTTATRASISAGTNLTYNSATGVIDYIVPSSSGCPLCETLSNKSTNTALGTSDSAYPSQNAVKVYADTKAPLASPIFTGTVTLPTSWKVGTVTILPDGNELNYVDGVTSNIQTQLNGKQASGTYVTSVSGTSPIASSGGTTPAISCPTCSTYTPHDVKASRVLGNAYQNTQGKTMFVMVYTRCNTVCGAIYAYTDSSNPPTTTYSAGNSGISGQSQPLILVVSNNNYYKVTQPGANYYILDGWIEWY